MVTHHKIFENGNLLKLFLSKFKYNGIYGKEFVFMVFFKHYVICKLEGAIILPTTKKIMHAKMCNNIVKPNPCFVFMCYTQRKTSCFCDLSSNDLTSVHM